MSTASTADATETIVERFSLKALVEACLIVEEGVATTKDTELGMMAGAGILPGPFARADEQGLDEVLRGARARRGGVGRTASRPRCCSSALSRQGRLGKKSGQGFFPYPNPDDGQARETCRCSRREATWGSSG